MKFKRTRKAEAAAKLQWKPMVIECEEGFDNEDFAGLVELEELDGKEYAMQTGDNVGGVVVYSGAELKKKTDKVKDKKKKLKNKKKDKKTVKEDDEQEEQVEELNEIVTKKAKKAKKTPQSDDQDTDKKNKKAKNNNGSGFVVTEIDEDQEDKENQDDDDEQEPEDEQEDSNNDNDNNDNVNCDNNEWSSLSVPDCIVKCLLNAKMTTPTEIQKKTIREAIDERQNIFGAAPTGSGKTLAFAIPLVTNILADRKQEEETDGQASKLLRGLILTPTRELAVQIKKHVENITKGTTIRTALIVGGLAIQKQERILQKGHPEIVVATPGRFWQIVTSGKISHLEPKNLRRLKYLIIDEADRMVEKSHFEELGQILEMLNETSEPAAENVSQEKAETTETEDVQDEEEGDQEVGEEEIQDEQVEKFERQYLIFSATLTMLKDNHNKKSFKKKDKDDQENLMNLLGLKAEDLKICDLTESGSKSTASSDQLIERIVHTMKNDKDAYLYYYLMANPGRTIVFCNSIDCIRRLINIFRFLELPSIVVHSSMQQKRRLLSIEKFTSMKNVILLATDVAARGLDIPDVNHVIHYQVPRTAEIYIHRSGRTARINKTGTSLILTEPQEEAWFLRNITRILNKPDIEEYETNSVALRKIKERLALAIKCDVLEHTLRKLRLTDDWFRMNRQACELDNSDDELPDDPDDNLALAEKNKNNRKLKQCQAQLKAMLREPIKFSPNIK